MGFSGETLGPSAGPKSLRINNLEPFPPLTDLGLKRSKTLAPTDQTLPGALPRQDFFDAQTLSNQPFADHSSTKPRTSQRQWFPSMLQQSERSALLRVLISYSPTFPIPCSLPFPQSPILPFPVNVFLAPFFARKSFFFNRLRAKVQVICYESGGQDWWETGHYERQDSGHGSPFFKPFQEILPLITTRGTRN